ncbi:MAG: phospholipase D-like domain-containing protein, partial [Pseudodonghicola sp.]
AYFDTVRESGVRVFRYMDGFMHQKVFVVDDQLAAVGSTNLDNRSFLLNFEVMALFFDAEIATQVDRMLREDFDKAVEMTEGVAGQSLPIRYAAPIARLLSPIL